MAKVLLIDDDANRMSAYIDIIEQCKHVVKRISSAEEALEYFRENKNNVDVIILDIQMPKPKDNFSPEETEFGRRTGLLLLEKIREIDKDIPIIILTVVRDIETINKARALGVNTDKYYFKKPALPSVILKAIEDISK